MEKDVLKDKKVTKEATFKTKKGATVTVREWVDDPTIKKAEERKRYLECNFCHAKDYEQHHKESGSSWCKTCGRCFPAIWKIEE